MRAELKNIHSPDVYNLSEFDPKEKDNFGILLQLMVSPLNSEGEESFDMILCTPEWLAETHNKSDIIFGRHYLIVFEYNYEVIHAKLKKYIDNIEEDCWSKIAIKISRVGKWEFEDYEQ